MGLRPSIVKGAQFLVTKQEAIKLHRAYGWQAGANLHVNMSKDRRVIKVVENYRRWFNQYPEGYNITATREAWVWSDVLNEPILLNTEELTLEELNKEIKQCI